MLRLPFGSIVKLNQADKLVQLVSLNWNMFMKRDKNKMKIDL